MATWEVVGEGSVFGPGGERLARVRPAGTQQEGWIWVGGTVPAVARAAGTEPGAEMAGDRRVWGSRADAETRYHVGLLEDYGRVTGL